MDEFKRMVEMVGAMPSGEDKTVMESLLLQVEKFDKAKSDYDAMSHKEQKRLPVSIRQFFDKNVPDDFDDDIPFDFTVGV